MDRRTVPQSFWQSHECGGYSAKVTVEWHVPDNLTDEAWNIADARGAQEAEEIFARLGPKTAEIVQRMRGR